MKINLDPNEVNALEHFEGSGMPAVAVIKKILQFSITRLDSIENIDPKGNMGLQTLANQNAVKELKEIRDVIFPGIAPRPVKPGQGEQTGKSQWR